MRPTALLASFASLVSIIHSSAAGASDLTYTPINPSFGGNPFNSSHLLGLATAQNEFKESKAAAARPAASPSERFVQILQSRLYSGLAQQISEAIFGDDAQPNGTFVFDDQQIDFVNDGDQITLTITNTSTGDITEISVPTL